MQNLNIVSVSALFWLQTDVISATVVQPYNLSVQVTTPAEYPFTTLLNTNDESDPGYAFSYTNTTSSVIDYRPMLSNDLKTLVFARSDFSLGKHLYVYKLTDTFHWALDTILDKTIETADTMASSQSWGYEFLLSTDGNTLLVYCKSCSPAIMANTNCLTNSIAGLFVYERVCSQSNCLWQAKGNIMSDFVELCNSDGNNEHNFEISYFGLTRCLNHDGSIVVFSIYDHWIAMQYSEPKWSLLFKFNYTNFTQAQVPFGQIFKAKYAETATSIYVVFYYYLIEFAKNTKQLSHYYFGCSLSDGTIYRGNPCLAKSSDANPKISNDGNTVARKLKHITNIESLSIIQIFRKIDGSWQQFNQELDLATVKADTKLTNILYLSNVLLMQNGNLLFVQFQQQSMSGFNAATYSINFEDQRFDFQTTFYSGVDTQSLFLYPLSYVIDINNDSVFATTNPAAHNVVLYHVPINQSLWLPERVYFKECDTQDQCLCDDRNNNGALDAPYGDTTAACQEIVDLMCQQNYAIGHPDFLDACTPGSRLHSLITDHSKSFGIDDQVVTQESHLPGCQLQHEYNVDKNPVDLRYELAIGDTEGLTPYKIVPANKIVWDNNNPTCDDFEGLRTATESECKEFVDTFADKVLKSNSIPSLDTNFDIISTDIAVSGCLVDYMTSVTTLNAYVSFNRKVSPSKVQPTILVCHSSTSRQFTYKEANIMGARQVTNQTYTSGLVGGSTVKCDPEYHIIENPDLCAQSRPDKTFEAIYAINIPPGCSESQDLVYFNFIEVAHNKAMEFHWRGTPICMSDTVPQTTPYKIVWGNEIDWQANPQATCEDFDGLRSVDSGECQDFVDNHAPDLFNPKSSSFSIVTALVAFRDSDRFAQHCYVDRLRSEEVQVVYNQATTTVSTSSDYIKTPLICHTTGQEFTYQQANLPFYPIEISGQTIANATHNGTLYVCPTGFERLNNVAQCFSALTQQFDTKVESSKSNPYGCLRESNGFIFNKYQLFEGGVVNPESLSSFQTPLCISTSLPPPPKLVGRFCQTEIVPTAEPSSAPSQEPSLSPSGTYCS